MKNIKKTLLLILLALVVGNFAQAQNVDDIIAKYFENTGGLAKWKELKSITMSAKMSMQGMEFPIIMYRKSPNMQKMEMEFQGKKFVQAYDSKTAWRINPFQGTGNPEKIEGDEAKDLVDGAEFESEFYEYAKKGHKAELEGKETIEGAECFKIKLTKKNGNVEYHFFDTENYVQVMIRSKSTNPQMQGAETETFMSDYKEVGGLMMPHFIEAKVKGQSFQKITTESIKLNEKMEDTIFAFPKQ